MSVSREEIVPRSRPTMRQVAALAGVGIKTVSRVINGEPNVSRTTTARVVRAAEQLDYHPNIHAGNLRRLDRRTRTMGLLTSSIDNPFAGALHRAVEDAAMDRGYAVFASSLDEDPARERSAVEAFLRRRVDALILTTIAPSQSYLGREMDLGTPVVFVDRPPRGIEADTVVSDNRGGAASAVRHLVEHGHRRIAYLGDSLEVQTARERHLGFLDELARSGVPASGLPMFDGLHDEAAAYRATEALLTSDDPPTAIFSAQNLVSIGVLEALRRHGAQHRIALVGFDDLPLSQLLEPGFTVVAQDPRRIGQVAAESVFSRLDGGGGEPRTVVVETTLIARGSGEIRPQG